MVSSVCNINIESSNPTSYIVEDLNVTKALEYLEYLNSSQSEVKVTMTHLLGHALGWGLHKMRRDVGRLTWGYFSHSKKLGITCLVDVEGGSDLVPITIFDAHTLTVIEFAKICAEKVNRAKNKKDAVHNQSTALASFVPSFVI